MDEEEKKEKQEKQIEIVTGDGSDLDISPVYEHLNVAKPKSIDKKEKNIVIPKESKPKKDKDDDNEDEEDDK